MCAFRQPPLCFREKMHRAARIFRNAAAASACAAAIAVPAAAEPAAEEQPAVTIGLIGTFAPWVWAQTLGPTLEYLRKHFPEWKIVTVELPDLDSPPPIDFFISQSGPYWAASVTHGAVHMATRLSPISADPAQSAGVAVVVPADRDDIRTLADLKGKTIAATDKRAFQGWGILTGTVAELGFDPETFFSEVHETHYRELGVSWEVATGRADAGIMQLCMFEREMQQHQFPEGTLKVLPYTGKLEQKPAACLHTTELYPDMVIAAMPKADAESVRRMTAALLTMPKLRSGYEWSSARDFSAVERLYKILKIGPYQYLQDWSPSGIWQRFRYWILLAAGALLMLVLHSARTSYLIRLRTRDLQQSLKERDEYAAEYARVQKRLSALEKSGLISQISSMVAHELKQPAGAIVNYTSGLEKLLSRGEAGEALLKQIIPKIHHQATEIAQIVDHVRSYAKASGGSRAEVDLCDIIRHSAKNTVLATGAPFPVRTELPEKKAPVNADPLELELALHNFLKNGIEAAQSVPGTPSVSIRLEENGSSFTVIAENSGPLLSEEKIAMLGKTLLSSSKGSSGLGLGLPISMEIIERHGGKTQFLRRPEGGLTVRITLPKASSEQKDNVS